MGARPGLEYKTNAFVFLLGLTIDLNIRHRLDDTTQSIVHIGKRKFKKNARATYRREPESGRRTSRSLADDAISSTPSLSHANTIGSIMNKPEQSTYYSLPLANGATSNTSSYANEPCDIQEHGPSASISSSDSRGPITERDCSHDYVNEVSST